MPRPLGRHEAAGISKQFFSLGSNVNRKTAAKSFKKNSRVLISDILSQSAAKLLLKDLSSLPDWNLVFRNKQKHHDLSASGFAALELTDQEEIKTSIYSCAQQSFGYMYKNYPVFDLVQSGNCMESLEQFLLFLNSDVVLNTVRRITGFKNIEFADAQATCYEPGHFLSSHNDFVAGKNRLAAYVFNLTPDWHPDWGGNLLFYDEDKNVRDAFVPRMNTLSLFAVGSKHAVSLVCPFARRPRISISGWFRFR